MKNTSTVKKFKLILISSLLIFCIFLSSCEAALESFADILAGVSSGSEQTSSSESDSITDTESESESESESETESEVESETETESESETESETESESDSETETETQTPDTIDPQSYFVATVNRVTTLTSSPYTNGVIVPDELNGICYSSDAPGGTPKNDGTGKIWLELKPTKDNCVDNITISGKYSSIESLGKDLYCIHGVESNLTLTVTTTTLPSEARDIFEDYGYGITDDGKMTVTWIENANDPIRYVKMTYVDSTGTHTKYVDASTGSIELFKMTENSIHTVTMQAMGYECAGQAVEISGCYMKAPKDVSFPRIEISTKNYIWPSCEFVNSPSGCWGSGITNAFYEQCIMTIYDENDNVVYNSTDGMGQNREYLGAKLKIRGNTSAHHESQGRFPYKVKLDKKVDLLEPLIGRPDTKEGYADKDWLLLNYGADGYRVCGDAIADAVGTEWSPEYCYVSLYLNGEYRGLYVLSEAVEEGSVTGDEGWRVNVDEDGYVFECDAYWWNEDISFDTPLTTNTPMHFTFKYPDSDNLTDTSPEIEYLKEYLTAFEEALMKDDDSYLEYIDLDSFVRWLLVSDFLCIEDGGGANLYLYKKDSTDSTKVAMGPNWDFDSYMGNAYALATIRMRWNGAPFYYQHLIKKDSFNQRYVELFNELKGTLEAAVNNAFTKIDIDAHAQLLQYDNKRFGTSTKSLSVRKAEFLEWLQIHVEWMETQFN